MSTPPKIGTARAWRRWTKRSAKASAAIPRKTSASRRGGLGSSGGFPRRSIGVAVLHDAHGIV
jgi:hypothetical protein